MWYVRLLRHQILYLPNSPLIQKRILCPQRQTQRLLHGVEICRYSHQAWVTLVHSIVSHSIRTCVFAPRGTQSREGNACQTLYQTGRCSSEDCLTAYAASTPPISLPCPLFFCPRACKIAYRPPQQNPIAPILFVPGIMRTVLTKPSIKGPETPSRCLASQGPKVAGTMAAFLALSTTLSVSCVLSGGSTFCKKDIGSESPS